MSNQYKDESEVPTDVICDRLEELSEAVTKGRDAVSREFTMRVPAEMDRDADLVLSIAAKRLRELSLHNVIGMARRCKDPIQSDGCLGVAISALFGFFSSCNWTAFALEIAFIDPRIKRIESRIPNPSPIRAFILRGGLDLRD